MTSREQYHSIYDELVGFTPPRIQHRVQLGLECDPELLDKVEKLREHAMYPKTMDVRTAQMMLFGILLAQVSPAAEYHGRAAMRAGATKEELHEVCGLAFLFRGLPAFNLGAQMINEIFANPDKQVDDIFSHED